MAQVTIELFGIPRLRAGRSEISVNAVSVGEALAILEGECPRLQGLIEGAALVKHYRLSLNGDEFLTDLDRELHEGEHLLLLSADVGG